MFANFALEFIRENQARPFFLYVPFCLPHSRYEIPSTDPYSEMPWTENEKVHAAMVTRMDSDVGRITALLEELEIDQNTLVFFCSDNGAANRWKRRFDSSGSLRGKKRDMYEGGIRTPMITHWPGHIKAGTESDLPWYFADVLPTLADLANVDPPAEIDGVSVLPTILGKQQKLDKRFLYWEYFEKGFQQAVRWGDWKTVTGKPGQKMELYDLANDIGETEDVASQHPDVVARIEAYLKTARTESKEFPTNR
jgi:arylsulfatase A-like enzyme